MNCPRCKAELKTEQYEGIEIDRCPDCAGMWLDYPELDQLEDIVLEQDEVKGTLILAMLFIPSSIKIVSISGIKTSFSSFSYDF